ncbi:hypothetical protein JTB14_000737 [Gonioctena quinquepunctata]|nr:hypothetical protein JTB14_000737 [Gonioctena quinquepunctata]
MEIPEKIPTKKVLLAAIKQRNFKKEYIIDSMCESRGHILLRLPPYYCVFNPIEMVWTTTKESLRKCNQSPTLNAVVLDNIRRVVNEVGNSEVWKNCVAHVMNEENKYYVQSSINPIVIQPDDDSTSSECSEEEF